MKKKKKNNKIKTLKKRERKQLLHIPLLTGSKDFCSKIYCILRKKKKKGGEKSVKRKRGGEAERRTNLKIWKFDFGF